MTADEFLRRLRAGKAVNCVYTAGSLTGLISAWPYGSGYVLTWEECPTGGQYDEYAYSRDERHQFETAEDVLAFAGRHGYPAASFTP